MKSRINLWQKIFITGMIPVLIVSVLLSRSSFERLKKTAYTLSENAIANQVKRIDLNLNTRMNLIESSLQTLSDSISSNYSEESTVLQSSVSPENYAKNMIAPFSEIRAALITLQGGQFYSTDESRRINQEAVSAILEEIKDNPAKSFFSRGSSSIFISRDSSGSFLLYKAVTKKGKNIGAVFFELSYRMMGYNILTQQRIQQSQTNFILNEAKQVVYADNYLPDNVRKALTKSYLGGSRRTVLKIDGKPYFSYMQYSGSTGWVIASFVPEKKLFSASALLRRQALSMWILGILFSSIFLMILSHALLRPVKHLKEAMNAVQKGDLAVTIKRSSSDEIGDLSSSFNYMLKALNEQIDKNYKQEIARQNAEMKALQAQINPHFLYNTLDSINWMLLERGEEDISKVVISLGKLMQYSIGKSSAIVRLKDEYMNIHNYLLLQKNRIEDKLNYTLLSNPEFENYPIPKLILQPLIENSIIHGIIPCDHPGTIRVATDAVTNGLMITIEDNGIGMDEEELKHFMELCYNEDSNQNIGVQNVMKRLFLFYGKDVEINVNSKKGKGTCIQLILPEREDREIEDRNH